MDQVELALREFLGLLLGFELVSGSERGNRRRLQAVIHGRDVLFELLRERRDDGFFESYAITRNQQDEEYGE